MNKFVAIYIDARKRGKNNLEAFGVAASHIAMNGTLEDLHEVDLYHLQDSLEDAEKSFEESKGELEHVNTLRVNRKVS